MTVQSEKYTWFYHTKSNFTVFYTVVTERHGWTKAYDKLAKGIFVLTKLRALFHKLGSIF